MTIARRLILITGVVVMLGLAIGSLVLWNSHQLTRAFDQSEASSQILQRTFLLRVLMDEYLAHGNERALSQWNTTYELLGKAIKDVKNFQSIDQTLLKELQNTHGELSSLESQIVQLETSGSQPEDSKALKETLAGMMSLRLEELVYSAQNVRNAARIEILRRQKIGQSIMLAASVCVIALILLNLYLIRRAVVRPVQELSRGAAIIGSGNFDHTIEMKSQDELGQLAAAFNGMVQRLRNSYESLEAEIRERKRAEEELIRSNQDLQQFAYVASHDLQEPLRNVASCLQMLEKKYKNNLDADADQYIHYAVESAVRMKALILDLLAYSRVSATKGKPPQRIDCEQILDQTVKNLRAAISEAGAVITHDPLPTIFADDTQLLQVFQNLIGNAIKFRRDEPPQIHVSAVRNKNEWIFSVKDNGIGIESRHLDRIFVIFQRLHKRSQYDGTGMGLAIVKKVVERHGGRVWVESEPGVGTTFYFTIPEKGIRT